MLLFCHQPPFLISWFSICKTLSPKHQHISLNTDLQGYQECEERGFQYLGGIARKDAAEECCWSERGRAAHTVIYMAGDVGTCTMESRAFGKEWEGWGKKEDGTKSFLVSSPAPQITHTHTPPPTLPGYSHLAIPMVLSAPLVQFCYSTFPLTSTPKYGSTKYNQTETHCRKMHKAQPTPLKISFILKKY